jgi:Fe-S-cluster containining protein
MTKVDRLDPKSWVRYNPSNCTKCLADCCTLPVLADAEDLFHMGYLRFDQVNGPLKRIAAKLKKDGIIRSFNSRTRVFTLARRKNNDCIFLDEKTRFCTIYDRRPTVCRDFPHNSARPGFCPKRKKPASLRSTP